MSKKKQLETLLEQLPETAQSGVLASNSVVKKSGNNYELWAGSLVYSSSFELVKDYINEEIERQFIADTWN